MKEDESWEDPKIYFERLEKFASSLGYVDDGHGFPIYDMLREIERLREEKKRLRDMVEKARPFLNMTMREHVGHYDEEYRGD